MRLVSFDPLRTLGIPGITQVKAEQVFRRLDEVRTADWVLFPQSWQVNFLHYGLKRRIFPSIASYHLGHDKVEMTRAFWSVAEAHVPLTLILPADESGAETAADGLGFPLVVKEPRNSMGRGVHLVENRKQLAALVPMLDLLYAQEYLPCERDLRVVVVGDRVLTAYWRSGGDGFLHNVSRGGELDFAEIPQEAVELALAVARDLGVDHAGFDLLVPADGRPRLIELNTMFGTQGLNAAGVKTAPVILEWLRRQTDDGGRAQGPPLRGGGPPAAIPA
ncbi:MAG TPA: hypothetical protein VKU40_16825 [Thermoanaerobaculia bacterium]|nr:hypothetical protein [Thermoanaerobaculia bacterium]